MKSLEQLLFEVQESLKAAGHVEKINEVTRQHKSLEGRLATLTEFAESVGATPKAVAANEALVEAAMNTFGMTKDEAEVFANGSSSDCSVGGVSVDDLLKEAK